MKEKKSVLSQCKSVAIFGTWDLLFVILGKGNSEFDRKYPISNKE